MTARSVQCVGVEDKSLFVEVMGRKGYIRVAITPPPMNMPCGPMVLLDVLQARELAAALWDAANDLERRLTQEVAGE